MGIKALIFDIDGTILNSHVTMTKLPYNALKECHREGLFICTATARSGRMVFRKEDLLWEHEFLLERGISYNGATIFDKPNHFYQHTAIPGSIVQHLVTRILDYDDTLQIALQHDDQYHAFKIPMTEEQLVGWGFRQDGIIDFQKARQLSTTKIMIFTGNQDKPVDLSELYQSLVSEFSFSVNIILADSWKAIYIISKHANKGKAINTLISLYNIKPEEVAVFGDDTPDIGMFGHSIAMGNAHESLKRHASFVTKTNDEEGVVFALTDYLKVI